MTRRFLAWYYSIAYAVLAWIDERTGWEWASDAAWDAVFAKKHYDGSLDRYVREVVDPIIARMRGAK